MYETYIITDKNEAILPKISTVRSFLFNKYTSKLLSMTKFYPKLKKEAKKKP